MQRCAAAFEGRANDDAVFEEPPALAASDGEGGDRTPRRLVGSGYDDGFEDPHPASPISFSHTLGIPGLHRIIDNATEGVANVMETYTANVFSAKQVCNVLR